MSDSEGAICNTSFDRRNRAPKLNTRVTGPTFDGRFGNGGLFVSNAFGSVTIIGPNGDITNRSCMSNVSNNAVADRKMRTVLFGDLGNCIGFLASRGWMRGKVVV